MPLGLSIYLSKKRAPHFFLLPPHTFVGFLKDEKWCVGPGFTPVSGKNSWGNGPQMASSGIFLAFPSAYLSISAENERLAPQPICIYLSKYRSPLKFQLYLRKKNAIAILDCFFFSQPTPPRVITNSDWFQWLCPGVPLQIEVKGHLNANIMAWYCMGVDMGVK